MRTPSSRVFKISPHLNVGRLRCKSLVWPAKGFGPKLPAYKVGLILKLLTRVLMAPLKSFETICAISSFPQPRVLFCLEIMEGWWTWKNIFLSFMFLLQQKAGVLKESPLSLLSLTQAVFSLSKMMVSLRKVHWVFFSKEEWSSSFAKKLNWLSFRTTLFCFRK